VWPRSVGRVTALELLLALQERDLALDRLGHRLATLPERDQLATAEAQRESLRAEAAGSQIPRDEAATEERRLEDEARSLGEQAKAVEQRLYSGEVSSPRELQALQADVEQLRRHQRSVEDRQLAAMERREPLDAHLGDVDLQLAALDADVSAARAALEAAEAAIGTEMLAEQSARDELARGIDDGMLGAYERCREKANGIGAARLVGMTCQGCHLSIPATEVDRIRTARAGTIEHCDNCGCILVP